MYSMTFDDTERHLMSVVLEQAADMHVDGADELFQWMSDRGGMIYYTREFTEAELKLLEFALDTLPTYAHTTTEQNALLLRVRAKRAGTDPREELIKQLQNPEALRLVLGELTPEALLVAQAAVRYAITRS